MNPRARRARDTAGPKDLKGENRRRDSSAQTPTGRIERLIRASERAGEAYGEGSGNSWRVRSRKVSVRRGHRRRAWAGRARGRRRGRIKALKPLEIQPEVDRAECVEAWLPVCMSLSEFSCLVRF